MGYIILFGGESYEHEISIVSAITLKKELENIAHFVFISDENELYLVPRDKMNSKHFSSFAYKGDSRLFFTKGGFAQNSFFKREILRGVVINLIHGKSGEDGQIPAILDFYGIDFIGPRIEASAISFNKELTKIYAKNRGVNVLDYRVVREDSRNDLNKQDSRESCEDSQKNDSRESCADSRESCADSHKNYDSPQNYDSQKKFNPQNFPCIIKPARLGSSIGIAIAKSANDLAYALDCAFEFDKSAIVEPFLPSVREFNLAGCKVNGAMKFSIIEEVKKREFFAFEDKYLDFQSSQKREADLSENVREEILASFARIYEDCFEGALIRCDFFLHDGAIYLNEINPIPGSLAHYLFSDFNALIRDLSHSLPKRKNIKIDYKYISKIQAQKGK